MATITFDTLKFAEALRESGFDEKQAKGMAAAIREVQETNLNEIATKRDLADQETATKRELMEMEIRLIKWMIAMLAGQGTLVVLAIKMLGH